MPSMDLTPEEARHIRRRRSSAKRDEHFRQGLRAAAGVVEEYGVHLGAAFTDEVVDKIMACKRPRKKEQMPRD